MDVFFFNTLRINFNEIKLYYTEYSGVYES